MSVESVADEVHDRFFTDRGVNIPLPYLRDTVQHAAEHLRDVTGREANLDRSFDRVEVFDHTVELTEADLDAGLVFARVCELEPGDRFVLMNWLFTVTSNRMVGLSTARVGVVCEGFPPRFMELDPGLMVVRAP
jgi:hypothetical protein